MDHFGVMHETELAVGVRQQPRRIGIKHEPYWIPKSVIVHIDESTVIVAGWWAEKEGL